MNYTFIFPHSTFRCFYSFTTWNPSLRTVCWTYFALITRNHYEQISSQGVHSKLYLVNMVKIATNSLNSFPVFDKNNSANSPSEWSNEFACSSLALFRFEFGSHSSALNFGIWNILSVSQERFLVLTSQTKSKVLIDHNICT